MSQQLEGDPFAFIEVQVVDCETANPEPVFFTHQLPVAKTGKDAAPSLGRSGTMVPPTDSDDDDSLSGSCSTDDDDDAKEASPCRQHTTSSLPTRGNTATSRSSRYASYPQEGGDVTGSNTALTTGAVREHVSGLVSLDDLPEPPPQDPVERSETTTPFERAPLDASKLTIEERRRLSVEEQKAKEETATINRLAELLLSTPPRATPRLVPRDIDTGKCTHLVHTEEELVGPDAHYSSPNNEYLSAEELLDTNRFNEGVPMEVRDGCRGALEAIMAAYR